VAAGITLLLGWEHPLAAADPAGWQAIVAHGPSDTAFVALAIGFWPYGLLLVGGFWTVAYAAAQWRAKRA
jgi:hypothetical protein